MDNALKNIIISKCCYILVRFSGPFLMQKNTTFRNSDYIGVVESLESCKERCSNFEVCLEFRWETNTKQCSMFSSREVHYLEMKICTEPIYDYSAYIAHASYTSYTFFNIGFRENVIVFFHQVTQRKTTAYFVKQKFPLFLC